MIIDEYILAKETVTVLNITATATATNNGDKKVKFKSVLLIA